MDKPNHPDLWYQKTGHFYVALKALFHNKTNECHNEEYVKISKHVPKKRAF